MRAWLVALALLGGCAGRVPLAEPRVAPPGWVCQRHYVAMERHLWVTLSLAADGTLIERMVGWRSSGAGPVPGLDLGWTVPPQGPWFASPSAVELSFAVPRPRKPVSALLYADDVLVGQGEVFDPAKVRIHRSTLSVGTGLSFYPQRGPVPALHGVERLALVTVEGDVRRAAVDVPLPEWAWVDAKVAEALPALAEDARSFDARCEREGEWEI